MRFGNTFIMYETSNSQICSKCHHVSLTDYKLEVSGHVAGVGTGVLTFCVGAHIK